MAALSRGRLLTIPPSGARVNRMTQGRPEDAAAQVAAALVEVALELGGSWRLEIGSDGQMRLAETDEDP
jgi:hypothetical protein